jgi:hypothetical protein
MSASIAGRLKAFSVGGVITIPIVIKEVIGG